MTELKRALAVPRQQTTGDAPVDGDVGIGTRKRTHQPRLDAPRDDADRLEELAFGGVEPRQPRPHRIPDRCRDSPRFRLAARQKLSDEERVAGGDAMKFAAW